MGFFDKLLLSHKREDPLPALMRAIFNAVSSCDRNVGLPSVAWAIMEEALERLFVAMASSHPLVTQDLRNCVLPTRKTSPLPATAEWFPCYTRAPVAVFFRSNLSGPSCGCIARN